MQYDRNLLILIYPCFVCVVCVVCVCVCVFGGVSGCFWCVCVCVSVCVCARAATSLHSALTSACADWSSSWTLCLAVFSSSSFLFASLRGRRAREGRVGR